MKVLLVAIILASAAWLGMPAAAQAHVVQAVSSFSLNDIDPQDRPQLEQALKTAVTKVLKDTIAFTPSFVALTDAKIIGERLYFKILIADEDGERTLGEINDRGDDEPDTKDQPSTVRTTL